MRRESRRRTLRRLPDGEGHTVAIERIEGGYRIETEPPGGGMTLVRGAGARVWSVVTDDGRSFEVLAERSESEIEVLVGPRRFRFGSGVEARSRNRWGQSSGRLEVRSPMPGKVVKVLVSQGETVTAGQPILLFEAMKMQNELRSPQDGIIARIEVEAGQAIEAREPLYVLDSSQ